MLLTIVPSKTERTTKARVRIDLKLCPMVMECIAAIPLEKRIGPLIVNDAIGEPFGFRSFDKLWRRVRDVAGLRHSLWNRDLRSGGIAEGSKAGASHDDMGKLAGHSGSKMVREIYDRDVLVSANRVAEARARFREKKKD
jgi:hypothetical protein